jgi:hypothetical protein
VSALPRNKNRRSQEIKTLEQCPSWNTEAKVLNKTLHVIAVTHEKERTLSEGVAQSGPLVQHMQGPAFHSWGKRGRCSMINIPMNAKIN